MNTTSLRSRSPPGTRLAIVLLAGSAATTACVLKNPPDAPAIKAESMASVTVPPKRLPSTQSRALRAENHGHNCLTCETGMS